MRKSDLELLRQYQELRRLQYILSKIRGGDVNEDISTYSTKALQQIQGKLYKIPVIGKVLQVVGENADKVVLNLFGIKSKLLPSAKAKEKGYDLFEYDRVFTPEELRYFGYGWITDDDQKLYSNYIKQFKNYTPNYYRDYNLWLHKNYILPPNVYSDSKNTGPIYLHWNMILSALTDAHGQLANINSAIFQSNPSALK